MGQDISKGQGGIEEETKEGRKRREEGSDKVSNQPPPSSLLPFVIPMIVCTMVIFCSWNFGLYAGLDLVVSENVVKIV